MQEAVSKADFERARQFMERRRSAMLDEMMKEVSWHQTRVAEETARAEQMQRMASVPEDIARQHNDLLAQVALKTAEKQGQPQPAQCSVAGW